MLLLPLLRRGRNLRDLRRGEKQERENVNQVGGVGKKILMHFLSKNIFFRLWRWIQFFADDQRGRYSPAKHTLQKCPWHPHPKRLIFFRKITEFRPLFSLFSSYLETVNRWLFNLSRRWLDSNPGPLVSLSNVTQSLAANLHWFLIG